MNGARQRATFLVPLLVVALVGCERGVIQGEVSLVVGPNHSAKLQGVSVALFRVSDLKNHLANRAREAPKSFDLARRIRALEDSARVLDQVWRSGAKEPWRQKSWPEAVRRSGTILDLRVQQTQGGDARKASFYLAGLPSPIASTETDAHGRFQLQTSGEGPFALVARASRRTGDHDYENYTWIVSVPKGRKVVLDDETLTSGHSKLSLLHTERDIVSFL